MESSTCVRVRSPCTCPFHWFDKEIPQENLGHKVAGVEDV